uniref:Uncharacterized protein n=1 Tax=viral metagenome TaxID=1070528 RepID=A0A6C0EKL2_9ZZZZ
MISSENLYLMIFAVIIIVCILSKDTNINMNVKMSESNSNFLMYVVLMGVVLFFIMRDVNQTEGFIAPKDYRLTPKCSAQNRNNIPLIKNLSFVSPIGNHHALTQDLTASNFTTVDGQPGSPRSMVVVSHNQFKPECCPSTYTTSTGCMCRNAIQDKFLQSGGGNK